ncbi:CHAT domain protein [Ceratobasidium sp. AG-Ba]|nr:CHAT domain protein [Ceratobasidium sp. AG-Ba]
MSSKDIPSPPMSDAPACESVKKTVQTLHSYARKALPSSDIDPTISSSLRDDPTPTASDQDIPPVSLEQDHEPIQLPSFQAAEVSKEQAASDDSAMQRVEKAIRALLAHVEHLLDTDPDKHKLLEDIATGYWYRYQLSDEAADLYQSATYFEQVTSLAGDRYANASYVFNMLGNIDLLLFKRLHDVEYLRKSLGYFEQSLTFLTDGGVSKASVLSNISSGNALLFKTLGNRHHLDEAIRCGEDSVALYQDDDPEKPDALSNLGNAYWDYFEAFSDTSYVEKAVACKEQAITFCGDLATAKSGYLLSLTTIYRKLFRYSQNREHIEKAIYYSEIGLSTSPGSSFQRVELLLNLAESIELRSILAVDPQVDERTTLCIEQVMKIVPIGHPARPKYLVRVGNIYLMSCTRTTDPEAIHRSARSIQELINLIPGGAPQRSELLYSLGTSYLALFRRLGGLENINMSIEYYEQAVVTCLDDRTKKFQSLCGLGEALWSRFEHSNQQEDIERAIARLRESRSLASPAQPQWSVILNRLGCALHSRFGSSGRLEDLEDAAECFENALEATAERSVSRLEVLANLANIYHSRFRHIGGTDNIQKAVDFQELVLQQVTPGHSVHSSALNNLGIFYQALFIQSGKVEDIDKAIMYGREAERLLDKGHPSRPVWLNNLGNSYLYLYMRVRNLEDLEKSVQCLERANQLAQESHPERPRQLECLGDSYLTRFTRLRRRDDLDNGIKCHEQAVLLTPNTNLYKPRRLSALGSAYMNRFEYFDEIEDLHRSIECQNEAAILTPDSHPEKHVRLSLLGTGYFQLFKRTHQSADLEKSFDLQNQALDIAQRTDLYVADIMFNLAITHMWVYSGAGEQLHASKAFEYFKQVAHMPNSDPRTKLSASKHWANLSPFPMKAYERAMTLLPQVVWLGDSIDLRHEHLAHDIQELVTESVSTAIWSQEYDRALEWLEQGRSVVWNQTMQLRSPFDELHTVDPALAQKLAQVSFELDSVSLPNQDDKFSNLTTGSSHNRRRLAEDWEKLLDQARLIPGFDDFLMPPKAVDIASYVKYGVAVVVNVHPSRCDALVVKNNLPSGNCMHIPLPNFSHEKARIARTRLNNLLRKENLRGFVKDKSESEPYSLRTILEMLWYDLVKPILSYLGYDRTTPALDDLPHITWCTTGPLSFLPLHAAGDYAEPTSILYNLAVSSYTPTLSLLRRSASEKVFSGILAIGQTSTSGLNPLPGAAIELAQIESHIKGLKFTRIEDEYASKAAVLDAMDSHSWVHFACHGSQNAREPMTSAFYLHDATLDLATISKKPLKNAQLAFLSACQTAAGDETLPEEAIHLAAGLMMAGYQTAIATMWSISDQSAPVVASNFYKYMLAEGEPDVKKAAKALHIAVQGLREVVGVENFEQWVPYIHMGN